MRQLAHDVIRQALGKGRMAQTAQHSLQQGKHPTAGALRDLADLHGIGKDEHDAAKEGKSKEYPPCSDPRKSALCAAMTTPAQISPEP